MDVAVKLLVLLVLVPTCAAAFTYLFLFKAMARMQQRMGPMETGPHGSLQLVAEGLKFLQKEDLIPAGADRLLFKAAPVLTLLSTFLIFAVLPAGPDLVVADLDVGVLYAIAVAGLGVLGVLLAGWASASTYSLLGGLRAAAQLVAYEVPLVLAALGVVVQAGGMGLQHIVGAQADTLWYVVPQAVGFVVFMIAAQAELTQAPFDMPVAETEVVAGYLTEYSGFRFLVFFLSELATAAALSALAAVLFLGGWSIPFLHLDGAVGNALGALAMAVKVLAVGFVIFWVRFSFPRLREDQLQAFAWKALIPVSLLNLVVTAACKVAF